MTFSQSIKRIALSVLVIPVVTSAQSPNWYSTAGATIIARHAGNAAREACVTACDTAHTVARDAYAQVATTATPYAKELKIAAATIAGCTLVYRMLSPEQKQKVREYKVGVLATLQLAAVLSAFGYGVAKIAGYLQSVVDNNISAA